MSVVGKSMTMHTYRNAITLFAKIDRFLVIFLICFLLDSNINIKIPIRTGHNNGSVLSIALLGANHVE